MCVKSELRFWILHERRIQYSICLIKGEKRAQNSSQQINNHFHTFFCSFMLSQCCTSDACLYADVWRRVCNQRSCVYSFWMEQIGQYRVDLPLCCSRLFCFSSVLNQSFQWASLLFLLTGWFLGLVNYYLVLCDLEISLTDNYSFTLMLSMEEKSLLLTACTDVWVKK